MAETKRILSLNDFEHRLMVAGLTNFRNGLINAHKPTEDVNNLILKVIDAPTKKQMKEADRDHARG